MKCSRFAFARSNFYILPHLQSFVKNFFQSFFDFRLSLWPPLVWQLFNFNTSKTICQEVFFVLFQTFWTVFFNFLAAVSNFYMLPHRTAFVKNFFISFQIQFSVSLPLADSLHILAHPNCFVKHEFSLSGNSIQCAFVSSQRVHPGIKKGEPKLSLLLL